MSALCIYIYIYIILYYIISWAPWAPWGWGPYSMISVLGPLGPMGLGPEFNNQSLGVFLIEVRDFGSHPEEKHFSKSDVQVRNTAFVEIIDFATHHHAHP